MKRAVLLTAYGSPSNITEVRPYLEHIRKGRPTNEKLLKEVEHRYACAGGNTPLLEITMEQARLLEQHISEMHTHSEIKVYVGMKHWHPFIDETISKMLKDGVEDFLVLPLAPHFSKISIGGYEDAVHNALKTQNTTATFTLVKSWHDNSHLVDCISTQLLETFEKHKMDFKTTVIFTAHSLPERIRTWGDPYEAQLNKTAELVAEKSIIKKWQVAFQSAGQTGEEWLGPDIVDAVLKCGVVGEKKVVICPIGFVSDHLEILFDLDIECKEAANAQGVEIIRVPSRNTTPAFIKALFDVARPWLGQN